jgi:hypothetical protein
MITPPEDVDVHESKGGIWWIDMDGILYSKSKKNAPKPTKEDSEEELKSLKRIVGDRKMCMIADISEIKSASREDRDLAAAELEKLVKAMAMVTTSPLSKMVVNLFFGLKPASYPVKIFNTEKEAKSWIIQYL